MTDSHPLRRAPLVATTLIALFVAVTVLVTVRLTPLMSFDHSVVRSWYGAVRGTGWAAFFDGLAAASQPWVVEVVLAVVAVALAVRRQVPPALWVVATMATAVICSTLIKLAVHRPRPDVAHQINGWSYPSGHATAVAAGMGLLLVLTAVHVTLRSVRAGLIAVWVGIALLVGADRIFVAAHYPSDVAGGWLLGALVVAVMSAIFGVTKAPSAGLVADVPGDATSEQRQTLAVVLNPIRIDNADAFKARVSQAATAAGWDEPLWFETTVDDAGRSMAKAAVAAGADLVVAAGGDGTVRVVCAEMAGTGVPVGVLPTGTGNLLARNLGVPLSRPQAIETILRGRDRPVDVVKIKGDGLDPTRFMVMAGLGLDAAIMDGVPAAMKARMGWVAYLFAGARQLRYPAVRVDISVDGSEPVRRWARTVIIGNVGSLQAGIPLLPDALIDDGVLDVVVIAPGRLLGWIGLVWRILIRHPRTDDRLDRFTGRSVVLTASHPTPRQIDGDTVGPGTEIRAEIEPGMLLIRVPGQP
ncbi:MAG: diacylglycerol kinase family protein [Nocardioidaceae bacterium]